MAGRSSDGVVRQVHRLFNVGVVGSMSDPQLLDQIDSHRDQAAEAAFEELMIRHGPMVFRVCRSVLGNEHDAEDAFQAVFLVLANRAGSIRSSGSIASWLFGVAHRVSIQCKRTASRRRALHERVAGRIAESYLPEEQDGDSDILHHEIQGVPERLRGPIVLCYLEGLSYAAAAHRLGLSETTIRGRLVRARERLRQRLIRHGVMVPAGLLVAGAASEAQAGIPARLIQATGRVAGGFIAGNTASILARGVLNAMLLERLRLVAALAFLGIGGSYWAWHSLAAAVDDPAQSHRAPAVANARVAIPPPKIDQYGDPLPAGAIMRLGTVRFRQAQSIKHIVYSPDGRLVVTGNGRHRLLVWDAQDGKMLRQVDLGNEDVVALAFSPDGTTIAGAGFRLDPRRNVVVNELTMIEAATGRMVHRCEWDDQESVVNVAYAAGGKDVVTVSLDGTLRLWDAATTNLRRLERLVGDRRISPESVAFSPDAARGLLAINAGATIDLWDVTQIRRVRTIALDRNVQPNRLVFSPDGATLAAGVGTRGSEIRLWRVGDGVLIGRLKSRKNANVSDIAFSPDGKVVAAIGSAGPLVFFDTAAGKELDTLSSVRQVDGPLAFSRDGKTLATTGDRQSLHFWEPVTGKDRLSTPEAHVGDVVALKCPQDGKTLVSGSRDGTVRIWDMATGQPTKTLDHDGWVESLAVSADGKVLATGTSSPRSAKVHVWNPATGDRIRMWSVEGTKRGSPLLRGVMLTADNSSVIAALGDGSLRAWDVLTGKERSVAQPKLEKFPSIGPGGGLAGVHRAVFSRGGRSVAMIGEGVIQVIDIASGERRFKESLAMMAPQCEFAPDGRSLAIIRAAYQRVRAGRWRGSSITSSTIVWLDSETGHVRREIVIQDSGVRSLAFSPDGQAIAVGTLLTQPERGYVRVFRLSDKREVQTIESPCPFIEVLAFTPDGKKIAAGLGDTSIVIWEVRPRNSPSPVE